MSAHLEAKLKGLGITLPEAPAPAANYVPFVQVGDIVYVSGQISATLEDQVLGRPFENLLGSLFDFQEVSLEPNFLGNQSGLGRFRMGTRLSKDLILTHEQENREFGSKKQTRLELKLDEELGLIFKREQTVDRPFDLFQGDIEKDFQFGFERRLKF